MLNRYLSSDPVPWLTDGENPAVTYLVKDEILCEPDKEKIYTELVQSPLTEYFRKKSSKGILGDTKHPDVFYIGTVWFFLLAVESGYKISADFISSTADYLCRTTQSSDGGFMYSSNPSCPVGCRTGNMVRGLLKCGVSDSRTDVGINWILSNQRKDGGWLHCPVAGFCDVMKLVFLRKSGTGLKYESDESIPSCPVATFTCLKAVIDYNSPDHCDLISSGIDFLIKNHFFINPGNKIICGNKIDPGSIGYPIMSQYDFLSGLVTVSKTGKWNHPVAGELFNNVIKNQNPDGTWNCSNNLPGMIKEKPGKSRWVTFNALRLINEIVKKENQ